MKVRHVFGGSLPWLVIPAAAVALSPAAMASPQPITGYPVAHPITGYPITGYHLFTPVPQ